METTQKLLRFLDESPTCYHAAANVCAALKAAGAVELRESEPWRLERGTLYVVVRGDSALMAFRLPEGKPRGFLLAAAHDDSPTFKLRENAEVRAPGDTLRLSVEPYGGGIWRGWLDRPLSVAGRVMVRQGERLVTRLVNIDRDLLVIPSVAIHMDRTVNKGTALNPAVDLLPLLGCGKETGADLKALESVDKWLNSEHGLSLNQPAFTKYYIQYGEISTYPAGYKENAGIFCHNNAWIICAEAFVGHGDKAFEYYSKIAPAYREEKYSDLHRTEPYVYAQMIAGKDAKRHGEAKNSWLTGTAAWNFVAVSQYILGVIPDWDGLKIDPSIPHEWDGFTISRQFRGATYDVTVKNPNHVCKGVVSVTVDGKAIEGNVLPVFADGKNHAVEVVMG